MMNLINRAKSQARVENIAQFLVTHGKLILRFFIMLFAVVILFVAFNFYQKSKEEKFSAILHQALINQQVGDVEKSKSELQKIVENSSAPSGVKSLASLRYAAILLEEGKKSEAEKIYFEVNNCGSCDDYVRDLAGLLVVKIWISDSEQLQKDDLSKRVEKIENKAHALKYHIAEQRAFLELQKNNLAESYKIFENISKNPDVSPALKARAKDGMKIVVAKGFDAKPEEKIQIKEEKTADQK